VGESTKEAQKKPNVSLAALYNPYLLGETPILRILVTVCSSRFSDSQAARYFVYPLTH